MSQKACMVAMNIAGVEKYSRQLAVNDRGHSDGGNLRWRHFLAAMQLAVSCSKLCFACVGNKGHVFIPDISLCQQLFFRLRKLFFEIN